jgi:hypothetical protein
VRPGGRAITVEFELHQIRILVYDQVGYELGAGVV